MSATVRILITVGRSVKVVADQLVMGLVSGGLLGPFMKVERRDVTGLEFTQAVKWAAGPERGEIVLGATETGETEVQIVLFCSRIRALSVFLGALIGAAVATGSTFLFDWLLHFSVPTGILSGGLFFWFHLRGVKAKLKKRVAVYLHNTKYLPM